MPAQGITVAPFRVVDEINQGMDPINERKVYTQLVEAASRYAGYCSGFGCDFGGWKEGLLRCSSGLATRQAVQPPLPPPCCLICTPPTTPYILRPGTPQCFLLTPKLLPGLPFNEAVTVLQIMNGAL